MRRSLLVIFFLSSILTMNAQCPSVFDQEGNVVTTPYWISCSGGDFNLNIFPSGTWDDFVIDWGDGSPTTTGGT